MMRDIVVAEPDTPVADVATLLERHRIKRVPIVRAAWWPLRWSDAPG
jgi:CBS domain-containing protein